MHEKTFRMIWVVISALNPRKNDRKRICPYFRGFIAKKEDATLESLGRIMAQGFE